MSKGALKRGDQGEEIIFFKLDQDPCYHKIINNLVLIGDNGVSHQIDHILIRTNGIFCIETKNYFGVIEGKEDDLYWRRVVNKGRINKVDKIFNPLVQNKSHIRAIKKALDNKYDVIGFITFVRNNIDHLNIFNVTDSIDLLRRINMCDYSVLSNEEIDNIYRTLLSKEGYINQEEHLKGIKKLKQERDEANKQRKIAIEQRICPICGSPILVKGYSYCCSKCSYKFKL